MLICWKIFRKIRFRTKHLYKIIFFLNAKNLFSDKPIFIIYQNLFINKCDKFFCCKILESHSYDFLWDVEKLTFLIILSQFFFSWLMKPACYIINLASGIHSNWPGGSHRGAVQLVWPGVVHLAGPSIFNLVESCISFISC